MAKTTIKPGFKKHLTSLTVARASTDEAVTSLETTRSQADRAISMTWHFLFDYLCPNGKQKKELPPPKLRQVTAIIHQIVQAMHKLGSLDKLSQIKQRENILALAGRSGLPPELRNQLEQELKILG